MSRKVPARLTPEEAEALRPLLRKNAILKRLRKLEKELEEELEEEEREIQRGLRHRPTMIGPFVETIGSEFARHREDAEIGAKSRAAGKKSAQLRRQLHRNVQMAEEFYARRQAAPEKVSDTQIIAEIGEKAGMKSRPKAKKAIQDGFGEILRRKAEK